MIDQKEKIEKDVNAVSLIIHLLLFRLGYSYEFERYLFNYSIKKYEKQEIINEIVFAIKTDNLDSIATIVPEFIEREKKRRQRIFLSNTIPFSREVPSILVELIGSP